MVEQDITLGERGRLCPRTRRALVVIAFLGLFVLAVRVPAVATTPAQQGMVAEPSTEHSSTAREADDDEARQYWTTHRLEDASPLSMAGHDSELAGGPQPQYEVRREGYVAEGSYSPPVGRLYFRDARGGNYVCSGTVVAQDLVLTAAHCVTSGRGDNRHFAFVPAQQGSRAPYGVWYSEKALYYRYFRTHEFYPLDYAFVILAAQNGGRHVGDVTGKERIAYDVGDGEKLSVGYPAEGDYFGRYCRGASCYQYFCLSPVGDYASWGGRWYEVGFGCHASGGHSGGPVFQTIEAVRYVVSVNSNGPTLQYDAYGDRRFTKNIWGPYFNSWVKTLYEAARRA
jgi:V8-like Glu-specific endopeptidase